MLQDLNSQIRETETFLLWIKKMTLIPSLNVTYANK